MVQISPENDLHLTVGRHPGRCEGSRCHTTRSWLGKGELVEMARHGAIILLTIISVCVVYAAACLPRSPGGLEPIRQPMDIAASEGSRSNESAPTAVADSSLGESMPAAALPGITPLSEDDPPAHRRRVLRGIETRVNRLAEILPERYPE